MNTIPFTTKREPKVLVNFQCNIDLLKAAEKERKKQPGKMTRREMHEWGLKQFILVTNPETAAKLGFTKK